VPEFLVEAYVSLEPAAAGASAIEEVSSAADQLTREGTPVRLLRSIYVPEDETCFYLFHAPSVDAVREAAARAGLRLEHVSEAISMAPGHDGAQRVSPGTDPPGRDDAPASGRLPRANSPTDPSRT
jgi:hypothetical protein